MKVNQLFEAASFPKIKWETPTTPSGKFKSFHKRGWPSASFADGAGGAAIRLDSADSYIPARVKTGDHKPLNAYIADWSTREKDPNAAAFEWKKLKGDFKTLDEAKKAALKVYAEHPEFWPKRFRPTE